MRSWLGSNGPRGSRFPAPAGAAKRLRCKATIAPHRAPHYYAVPFIKAHTGMLRSRILLVEDEVLVAEIVAAVLGEEHDVACVGSAADAASHLRRGETDLVLLDCLLPGGGVDDVIGAAEAAGTPVVLMSGDTEQADELRVGARPFLAKPFALDALLETVRGALARG